MSWCSIGVEIPPQPDRVTRSQAPRGPSSSPVTGVTRRSRGASWPCPGDGSAACGRAGGACASRASAGAAGAAPRPLARPPAAARVHDAVELGAQAAGGVRIVAQDGGGVAAPQELDRLAMGHDPGSARAVAGRRHTAPGADRPIQPKIVARQLATTTTGRQPATLAPNKRLKEVALRNLVQGPTIQPPGLMDILMSMAYVSMHADHDPARRRSPS